MKKVAIYIRVSTQEQVNEGYSIQAQKEKLINYCKAKSWNIYDIYVDGGFSGSNLERPGINKLLKNLKNIDIVLVYKLDRLSRSQKDTLYLIEEKFLENNVDFVSLSESFDTTTPFGRAMIGILSVFAQLERETINERSKLGKEERAKQGLWRGGNEVPFGYDYEEGKLIINDYQAMQVRKIFDMYCSGYGAKKIAKYLKEKGYKFKGNEWYTYPSIRIIRIIQNPIYAGKIKHNGNIYEGQHEAIIDEKTWDTAQRILQDRRKKIDFGRSKYLLNGFLECGYCGAKFAGYKHSSYKNKQYYYYVCYSRKQSNPSMVKDTNCKNKSININKAEQFVISKLRKKFIQFINREDSINKIKQKYYETENCSKKNDNKILEQKIEKLDKEINKLMELYKDDRIPASLLGEKIASLHEEKQKLENTLKKSDIETVTPEINIDEILNIVCNFDAIWEEATLEEKKVLLNTFIDKIIVNNKNLAIKWKDFFDM